MGGVWTVPMAAVASLWGVQSAGLRLGQLSAILKRATLLGAGALIGFFVTTPYAFTSRYYLDMLLGTWRLQGAIAGGDPFGAITIWSWATAIYTHIGPIGAALAGLGVAWVRLSIGHLYSGEVLGRCLLPAINGCAHGRYRY